MCAKCKLQLGEHLLDNQATSYSIHQQCHDFSNSDKIPIAKSNSKVFIDNFPFQELNSKELIEKQNKLRNAQNLINSKDEAHAFNQNLINDEINSDGEIFLIN
jgi:hypothetical protein